MKTDWTKEEIRELMFTEVELSDNGKRWSRRELTGYMEDCGQCYYDQESEAWRYLRPIPVKRTVPMSAKTCPRRPSLRHRTWPEGKEVYPNIIETGLHWQNSYGDGLKTTWEELANIKDGWTQGDGSAWTVDVEGEQ